MKVIDPLLQAKLDSGATTLCRCWLVVRNDGQTIGFTNHDGDVTFDGTTFMAGTGLDAGAIEASTGLSVDNTQAVGALSATGLTREDVLAGVYDGARVEQWLVDWSDTDLRLLLFKGTLGEIQRGDSTFSAEIRGVAEALNKPVGRSFMYECDAVLGDARCRFDTETPGYFVDVVVSTAEARRKIRIDGIVSFAEGWFENGRAEWTSGANAGVTSMVKLDIPAGISRDIEFFQETPFEINPGDALTVFAGCDKRPDTCRLKFLNFPNYRGFPQMPGEDWVSTYPTSGGVHDGGSQQG